MNDALKHHRSLRKLTTLVENQTTYHSKYSELHIFETHQAAQNISLTFDFPVIASMLTGKKVMHLEGMDAFEFVPGQSVVMPSRKEMVIDFPIAKKATPTQCLALGIDGDKIQEVANSFNHSITVEDDTYNFSIEEVPSHLTNNADVNSLIERLVNTFVKQSKSQDVLLDLMIQELIVRLLQTQAKYSILTDPLGEFSDTRIATVIKYIHENLTDKTIGVETLAEKAYMSTSHFYKQFKNTLGISPIDYINAEKIKFSKKLIKNNKHYMIADVAFKSGFNSVSYFNRQFRKHELMTPQQFKKQVLK